MEKNSAKIKAKRRSSERWEEKNIMYSQESNIKFMLVRGLS